MGVVGNAGILTEIPAYAGQLAFMRVCWEHCIPPTGISSILRGWSASWSRRFATIRKLVKCTKLSVCLQVEEERLHCICKGDFCNEDIIPGSGHNFFNFSAKVSFWAVRGQKAVTLTAPRSHMSSSASSPWPSWQSALSAPSEGFRLFGRF